MNISASLMLVFSEHRFMEIKYFCPIWGSGHLPLREFMRNVKASGYDGVEFGFPLNSTLREELLKVASEFSLQLIAQQYDAFGESFAEYKISFQDHLEFLSSFNPMFINSQTGKDYYTFGQNSELIELAKAVSAKTGIPVIHETHRGKFPFCVSTTAKFVDAFPDIRFTADFSHFCAVSESFLQDQLDDLQKIIKRSDHIHARVGHSQGPQVSDPRLPEWETALNHHLNWWDAIVENHRQANSNCLTITPEFGPAPYMFHLPDTNRPVASQWDINIYMMQLLKIRYN